MTYFLLWLKNGNSKRDLRVGCVIQMTYFCCRTSVFVVAVFSHHQHGGSDRSVTPVPEVTVPYSRLERDQAFMCCTYRQADKIFTYVK